MKIDAFYLHKAHAISAQESGSPERWKVLPEAAVHRAVEPDYTSILSPAMVRRMSRVVKMGVYGGLQCLSDTESGKPDAIITATAMGCFEDSFKFLEQLLLSKERMLSPTPFIQSTHNTVGAQIALLTKCNGYNNTHVHGGHSFENAILDTSVYLKEHPDHCVLLGAAEEHTPVYVDLLEKSHLGNTPAEKLNIGEGSFFFLVKRSSQGAVCSLSLLKTLSNPSPEEVTRFLAALNETCTLVISGVEDALWHKVISGTDLSGIPVLSYKRYSGQYATSVALAVYAGFETMAMQKDSGNLLIANRTDDNLWSFILLTHA